LHKQRKSKPCGGSMPKYMIACLWISLLLLNSCSTTQLTSICPDPVFPSRQVIDYAALPTTPDIVWQTLVKETEKMVELQACIKEENKK